MSKVIKPTEYRPLSHVVQTEDGTLYMVSSDDTFDYGRETMVFPWSKRKNGVKNWAGLYCERYKSDGDMYAGHKRICENLEEYIGGNENEL